jgi:hypothetical protein
MASMNPGGETNERRRGVRVAALEAGNAKKRGLVAWQSVGERSSRARARQYAVARLYAVG